MKIRFEGLDDIRDRVIHNKYNNGEELEADINALINNFWQCEDGYLLSNEDLFDRDLSELNSFHTTLIKKVINIHKTEHSKRNNEVFYSNIDLRRALVALEDGKRGNKIYGLNKKRDYVFVGDIHSDDISLQRGLAISNFYDRVIKDNVCIIFTGDYVDRGHAHLRVMERLMILKYIFPSNIMLLRGNHDGGFINEDKTLSLPYRIRETDYKERYFAHYMMVLNRYNATVKEELLGLYLEMFDSLGYVAIVGLKDKTIMALHGGIPRAKEDVENRYTHLNCIADITSTNILDSLGNPILNNIIWSDPYDGSGEFIRNYRRFHYTKDEFDDFTKRFNMDVLVRGHQVVKKGYLEQFDNRVITLTSSGVSEYNNKFEHNTYETAYRIVTPKVLCVSWDGQFDYV